MLLNAGANQHGFSAILKAAICGDADMMLQLLLVQISTRQRKGGYSLLLNAVMYNQVAVVVYLIERWAVYDSGPGHNAIKMLRRDPAEDEDLDDQQDEEFERVQQAIFARLRLRRFARSIASALWKNATVKVLRSAESFSNGGFDDCVRERIADHLEVFSHSPWVPVVGQRSWHAPPFPSSCAFWVAA